jgi:hypothetical protein
MMGIGARLTEAREARGVTLEQAERETRIIRRYLTALEEEDFGVFPAEVYARGFLRSYSAYLGLNPDDLLRALPRTTGFDAILEPQSVSRRRPNAAHGRGRTGRSPPARRTHPGVRLAGAVGAGLLLAALIGRLTGGAPDPALIPPGARADAPADGTGPPSGGAPVPGRMPDLRGMEEGEALRRLTELGVTPFVIAVPSTEVPAGHVLRQSPVPNAPIGSALVTIVISQG